MMGTMIRDYLLGLLLYIAGMFALFPDLARAMFAAIGIE